MSSPLFWGAIINWYCNIKSRNPNMPLYKRKIVNNDY
jgi:hypothetical protein